MAGVEQRGWKPRSQRVNNSQREIQPSQSGHITRYESAIKQIVPEAFFKQASKIVESRKPTDPRLKDVDILAMAKILVVEDDSEWADNHKEFAVDAGHEVVTATSAEEAKKALEDNGIDYIITDGLENKWTQVHDLAKEKGIRTVVVSSSSSVEREAEKRGVEYIFKTDTDLIEKLPHTFGNI